MQARGTLVICLACSLTLLSTNAEAFNAVHQGEKAVRWHGDYAAYKVGQEIVENKDNKYGSNPLLAIQKAFESWNIVSGHNMTFDYDGSYSGAESGKDGQNTVGIEESNWPYGSGVLAMTVSTYKISKGEMIDSDIRFNGVDYEWGTVDPENNEFPADLQNVATHEIGHFMGLDHSSESPFESNQNLIEASMYYSTWPGDISGRSLDDDDKFAVRYLYPEGSISSPTLKSVSPEIVSNLEQNVVFELTGSNLGAKTLVRLYHSGSNHSIVGKPLGDNRYEFNLIGEPSGNYDIVAGNAYNSEDRLVEKILVGGVENPITKVEPASGGCGFVGGSTQNELVLLWLALSAITLLMLRKKAHAKVRVKRPRRYRA